MYESPIEVSMTLDHIVKEAQKKADDCVFDYVFNIGINVDKDELIKALKYDREQYSKGFKDALQKLREKCNEHQDFHKGDDGVFKGWISMENLDRVIDDM